MTKLKQRDIATSLTAGVFLIIAISGLMLFFHINEGTVKNLHEYLGIIFVVAALLHVTYNWKSMKGYFSKKIFIYTSVILLAVSSGFICNAILTNSSINPKKELIVSMLNAPFENALAILDVDLDEGKRKLQEAGIKINGEKSLQDLAKANKTSPFRVVSILLK